MNDTDYIRKAVELADGWDLAEGQLTLPNGKFTYVTKNDFPQYYLDALAAQLVRQVDALEGYWILHDGHGMAIIHSNRIDDGFPQRVQNSDRTLNTIRCIVDSGVLDTDREGQ
jgi:hypothetical protein